MVGENIMFFENDDESYTVIDLYLDNNRFFGCKDSCNYYDIDVDNILLFKKGYSEYVIRYNDVNKMEVASLKLKKENLFGEIKTFTNNDRVMFIYNDDKEFFKKCREIYNKITELISINNTPDFVRTNFYDDEFIIANVHKNTSFVEGNYRGIIVLYSVINNYLGTSLTQVKTNKCT